MDQKSGQEPRAILIVDDEPGILSLLKLWLESHGYQVLPAKDGGQALDLVEKHPVLAVLLDLGLKGMNGLEVLSRIKKIRPFVPVLMISGSLQEQDARRAVEMGALDYITKPIDFNYLMQVLEIQRAA